MPFIARRKPMNVTNQLDSLPDVLTVDEVASVLRIGRSSVYEAIRHREIRAVRIGRRVLIPKTAIQRMLDAPDPET
jgi:excisionase family DNA binding protein